MRMTKEMSLTWLSERTQELLTKDPLLMARAAFLCLHEGLHEGQGATTDSEQALIARTGMMIATELHNVHCANQ